MIRWNNDMKLSSHSLKITWVIKIFQWSWHGNSEYIKHCKQSITRNMQIKAFSWVLRDKWKHYKTLVSTYLIAFFLQNSLTYFIWKSFEAFSKMLCNAGTGHAIWIFFFLFFSFEYLNCFLEMCPLKTNQHISSKPINK